MASMNEIIQQLWEASNRRKSCRVTLSQEPFPRVIHPYGVCKTSGNKVVVVCEQVRGFTQSGNLEGYRNLELNRIKEVEILKEKFQSPTDFDPSDIQYKEWVYHIQQPY